MLANQTSQLIDFNNFKKNTAENLKNLIHKEVKQNGLKDFECNISLSNSLNVSSREKKIEEFEINGEKGLSISVYHNGSVANVASNDFSAKSISLLVEKAAFIAKNVEPDKFSGLPHKDLLYTGNLDLDLYHNHSNSIEAIKKLVIATEEQAMDFDKKITGTEGASFYQNHNFSIDFNSLGFDETEYASYYSLGCCVLTKDEGIMHRGYYSTQHRNFNRLLDSKFVAEESAKRAIAKIGAVKLDSQVLPVLFTESAARTLIGTLTSAIAGSNIYLGASFLKESLNKQVFSANINIYEDPFIPQGMASRVCDNDGIATQAADLITDGVLNYYLLSNYSAKRLDMQPNGHSGGHHNLLVNPTNDINELLNYFPKLLVVKEFIGQGVNINTGDFSKGVIGCIYENGKASYPIHEVTIAGNLKDFYKNIVGIGNDVKKDHSIQTGSILVDNVSVSGK